MGVPKRRTSKSKKNMRRSAWRKYNIVTLNQCPKCHEFKEPHKVCFSCGFYKDKKVFVNEVNENIKK